MKRIWKSLLVLAVFCLFTLGAAADEQIRVYLDGKEIAFDTPPTIINGNTLVPMRAIFEALGAEVSWDGDTECVTATRVDTEIKLFVGDSSIWRNNYRRIAMPCPTQLMYDRVYVPVRAISECFGCRVDWCEQSNAVVIFTEKAFDHILESLFIYNDVCICYGYPFGYNGRYALFLEKGAKMNDYSKAKLLVPLQYTCYDETNQQDIDGDTLLPRTIINPEDLINNPDSFEYYRKYYDIQSDLEYLQALEYYQELVKDYSPSGYTVKGINGFNSWKELYEYCSDFCVFDEHDFPKPLDHLRKWSYWEYNGKLYELENNAAANYLGKQGGSYVSEEYTSEFCDENGFTLAFQGWSCFYDVIFHAHFINQNGKLLLESVQIETLPSD